MKKNLASIIAATGLWALSLLPAHADPNWLKIVNYSDSQTGGTKNNFIAYCQGAAITNHAADDPKGLKIRDAATGTNNVIVDTSIDSIFTASLSIPTNTTPYVTNGSQNALRIKFYSDAFPSGTANSTYPANVLITAQAIVNGSVYTNIDIIAAAKLPNGQVNLPNINTSGPNPYASLRVAFTRKESSQPLMESIANDGQTNVAISVGHALPGSYVTLEAITNLSESAEGTNWNPLATNYVGVTPENFGTNASTAFNEVPVKTDKCFYRAKVK
jgi:hypothetical protein